LVKRDARSPARLVQTQLGRFVAGKCNFREIYSSLRSTPLNYLAGALLRLCAQGFSDEEIWLNFRQVPMFALTYGIF
jgi:hypothetical protein